jgi:hypothetical protein
LNICSLRLCFETFLILGIIKRDVITHMRKSTSTRYFCQILMKLKFSRQIFEESSNIKFHENPSIGSELFCVNGQSDRQTDGRTADRQSDRQTDMTNLRVAFHSFAIAPKLSLGCPTHSPPDCVLLPAAIFLNVKYSYKII